MLARHAPPLTTLSSPTTNDPSSTSTKSNHNNSTSTAFNDVVAQLARSNANQARFTAMYSYAVTSRHVLLLASLDVATPSLIYALFANNNSNNSNSNSVIGTPSFTVFVVAPSNALWQRPSLVTTQSAVNSSSLTFQSIQDVS